MYAHWEIYDKEKIYLTEDGGVLTYSEFEKKYQAVNYAKMAVYCYDNVIVDAKTLSYLRGINRISYDYTDEQAIDMLSEIEEDKKTESTPVERIASALEFIELLLMEKESFT